MENIIKGEATVKVDFKDIQQLQEDRILLKTDLKKIKSEHEIQIKELKDKIATLESGAIGFREEIVKGTLSYSVCSNKAIEEDSIVKRWFNIAPWKQEYLESLDKETKNKIKDAELKLIALESQRALEKAKFEADSINNAIEASEKIQKVRNDHRREILELNNSISEREFELRKERIEHAKKIKSKDDEIKSLKEGVFYSTAIDKLTEDLAIANDKSIGIRIKRFFKGLFGSKRWKHTSSVGSMADRLRNYLSERPIKKDRSYENIW